MCSKHQTVFTTVGWPEHAGLAFKGNAFGSAEAQQTLDVNFYGTKRATDALLLLIPDGGSIVNVCRRVPDNGPHLAPGKLEKPSLAKMYEEM